MSRPSQSLIVRGATGGLLAGLVVALWFLVVDSIAGQPFRTPLLLSNALFHNAVGVVTLRAVVAYSVLHFGVFAVFGVAMAALSAALSSPPRLLLGVVFGLLLQEAVFYSGLLLSGARGLGIVPWAHVFLANILSGIVLMAFLHRVERDERPFGLAVLRSHPLLSRGIVAGLVGAGTVALWFLIFDFVSGRPLFTPAALGSALLFGASEVTAVRIDLGVVAAYTIVHVGCFVVAGVILVAVAEQVERRPEFLMLATMFTILLEALVVAALALGAEWVLGILGIGSVVVANVLAVSAMGWTIWRTHPQLRHRLHEPFEVHV